MEQTIKVSPCRSIEEIKEIIDKSVVLNDNQKNVLRFLLGTENSWLHFSFDEDWDLTYSQNKIILVQDLIKNSSWTIDLGECMLENLCYMIVINFKENLTLNSLYDDPRSRTDNRESFKCIEIYLTKHDLSGSSVHLLGSVENIKDWINRNFLKVDVLDIATDVAFQTNIFLRSFYCLQVQKPSNNPTANKFLVEIMDDLHNMPYRINNKNIFDATYELNILKRNIDKYVKSVYGIGEEGDLIRSYGRKISSILTKLPDEETLLN